MLSVYTYRDMSVCIDGDMSYIHTHVILIGMTTYVLLG